MSDMDEVVYQGSESWTSLGEDEKKPILDAITNSDMIITPTSGRNFNITNIKTGNSQEFNADEVEKIWKGLINTKNTKNIESDIKDVLIENSKKRNSFIQGTGKIKDKYFYLIPHLFTENDVDEFLKDIKTDNEKKMKDKSGDKTHKVPQ